MNSSIKDVLKSEQGRFCVRRWTHRPTLCSLPASGMQQKVPRPGRLFGIFVVLQETSECETAVLVLKPTTWRVREPTRAYTQRNNHQPIRLIKFYLLPHRKRFKRIMKHWKFWKGCVGVLFLFSRPCMSHLMKLALWALILFYLLYS